MLHSRQPFRSSLAIVRFAVRTTDVARAGGKEGGTRSQARAFTQLSAPGTTGRTHAMKGIFAWLIGIPIPIIIILYLMDVF